MQASSARIQIGSEVTIRSIAPLVYIYRLSGTFL